MLLSLAPAGPAAAVAHLASDMGAKQAETGPCARFAYLSAGPGGDPPLGVD